MSQDGAMRATFKSLSGLIAPRAVAIVGATERASWPKQIFESLLAAGFQGAIHPVNPRLAEVWGRKCFADLASLPEPPEHALVIVPAPAVQDVLETGVAAGLKSATIYAGNLGEGADPAILARGEALRALIARSGLMVNGPNCMGGDALHTRFFGYPNKALVDLPPGSVACVSQSGGTLQFLVQTAAARGVRFSTIYSSGNELDIDLADFVNHFVDDPTTSVIALFIEGVRRPAMFMRAAARALEAGKPIIAIKTGRSERSRAAAQSHTGAIAGDYAVFQAMCERYGIVVCPTLDDMVETMLVFQAGRVAQGARVGWVTTSGGTVDLLYDYIEAIGGVETPAFAAETQAAIRDLVPAELALKNPLDAGIPSTDANAATMCLAVARDRDVDILAWANVLPSGGKRTLDLDVLKTIATSTDKPVVAFSRMNYMVQPEMLSVQDELGIPFLQALPPTVRALGSLAFHGARRGRALAPIGEPTGERRAIEADLEATLARHGLTPPRSALAQTPEQAGRLARDIGFPVALKIVAPRFTHKTEIGGVRLGLASADEVERNARDLLRGFDARAPGEPVEGFLVQEMARGVEVLLGARNDPLYGPVLVVGSGGVFVEMLEDVAFRLLPIEERDARAMLSGLKLAKLLSGWRGAPACDVDALVRAMCGLSDLFLAHRHQVDDIEINPLIVGAKGEGVRAVDVRLVRR